MLTDAGWIQGKNWLNEVELPGMPNNSEVGFADYVLYDDTGKPTGEIFNIVRNHWYQYTINSIEIKAIGENAFANQGREKANRIFLQGNYEAWLEAFKVNHHIIPLGNDAELAAFNDGWEEIASGTTIRKRSHVIDQMIRDDDICRIEDINNTPKNSGDDKVTLLKRGLLAYAVRKHSGNASYSYGCWIFKVPREGLKVIVK